MKQSNYQFLKTSLIALSILGLIAFQGCYYDDEANLYPQIGGCDNSNVTYTGTISVIMNDNCNACHSGPDYQGNVKTDSFTNLKVIVDNGKLWGCVNHDSGFLPMPKDRPKLSNCDLSKIRIWLDGGALNN